MEFSGSCVILPHRKRYLVEVLKQKSERMQYGHIYKVLMRVKEESEKVGLKLSIHKMKIMASGPITSWEIH